MSILRSVRHAYSKWARKKAIKILTTADPLKIVAHGERSLLTAFHRAVEKVPAYRDLLLKRGVEHRRVRTLDAFKQLVPVITKEDVFPVYEIEELCVDKRLDRMKSPMSSSGFSGIFSFGINTEENLKKAEMSIDTALDYTFNISDKKTFVINCVPMGVKIPTSLPVADTSVRSDMALAIFKKFSQKFDQTIFVSDPHFLKKLLEDGIEQGIDWKRENVHLVSGEDWFPESFRSYLGHILGTDWYNPGRGVIGATMGIAELDLNLFHESVHTIQIRREAEENEALRKDFFGDVDVCPLLFHYYPHRLFLESLDDGDGQPELVFSMLSNTLLIPLMRYNSKDRGTIISYHKVKEILEKHGKAYLMPPLKLPLVAVGGRKGRCLMVNNHAVTPERVRALLYSDLGVAGQVTGNFLIESEGRRVSLKIQLKMGVSTSEHLQDRCNKMFAQLAEATVTIIPYFELQSSLSVDYEKKFRHLL